MSNRTNFALSSKRPNISLKDSMANLFVEEWSTATNYSKYFTACAPKFCTYTKTEYINFSSTIALLLSLYSGLTIMLRIIAVFVIRISFNFKRTTFNRGIYVLI